MNLPPPSYHPSMRTNPYASSSSSSSSTTTTTTTNSSGSTALSNLPYSSTDLPGREFATTGGSQLPQSSFSFAPPLPLGGVSGGGRGSGGGGDDGGSSSRLHSASNPARPLPYSTTTTPSSQQKESQRLSQPSLSYAHGRAHSHSPTHIQTHTTNSNSNSHSRSPSTSTSTAKVVHTRKLRLASASDRAHWDNLANLFSIIQSCEMLEKAYAYKSIDYDSYRKECGMLINHFKTTRKLTQLHSNQDISQFMRNYNLSCPVAFERLVEIGVPHGEGSGKQKKLVAEVVQHFITVMDSLRLHMTAVDELLPLLSELADSVNRSQTTFAGLDRVMNWLTRLNSMKASDELNEEDERQLGLDLDSAYAAFHKSLE